ncbi:hypothetical protein B296_00028005 [Ensete ventricosum]|uniref:Uncharacterized protein n=1 Tax=Ensete ventricosum TaxID=4639 RepID=A0A426ZUV1_ENSVE|nr:hypothetical protein B296_00028005 [Ensete ventricosum]
MGVSNVTPPTFKLVSRPPSGGSQYVFFETESEREVVVYGESAGAEVRCEGVVCHAALVAHGGGSPTRRPVDSTSDTNVAVGLTWVQTQVRMASSPSFTIFSFSFVPSSLVPLPRVEECRPSGSSGNQSSPPSSSSGVMTQVDAKALQALEAMKLFHNFDSIVNLESLASIGKRYSISNEYKEIQRLKDGGDPNALGADEQQAIEAQSLADHLKVELEETTRQWESLKKELSKTQDTVSNLHDQLVEA